MSSTQTLSGTAADTEVDSREAAIDTVAFKAPARTTIFASLLRAIDSPFATRPHCSRSSLALLTSRSHRSTWRRRRTSVSCSSR